MAGVLKNAELAGLTEGTKLVRAAWRRTSLLDRNSAVCLVPALLCAFAVA